jgi:hypothetical protein
MSSYPSLMANAREDLAATIDGRFSPEDWEKILHKAKAQLEAGGGNLAAWQNVIRDFHREKYWGFVANYRPAKTKRKKNLGFQLIWLTFNSLTTMKVAVLWFGQIYSRSDEPTDKWIFLGVIALALGNILFFLWSNRHYED